MDKTEEWEDDFEIDTLSQSETPKETPEKKQSRLRALREKINKLRGHDPDIYPMW